MVKVVAYVCATALILADSASAFQTAPSALLRATASRQACAQGPVMAMEGSVSRRGALSAFTVCTVSLMPIAASADGDKPLIPESEQIKPPANSCAQGVGGKCTELAEGNPLILDLQKKSAENRLKYQKQELESYWNRNYKDFFDTACTAKDTKCGFEQTADGKWVVKDKKPTGVSLKAFKDRGVDYEGAAAAKGAGIPPPFKKE